ncbi:hypothetical protein TI10_08135 [Photorhabdus luminescens subsp. luminescens]|uniref:Uncharacterized protein n=1 Tax=Photorhabdus luminescens TaxID=29488 RepID=A0A1G5QQK8_PHOLU|nr:hypothetical protein [Photorhabdus luminescens]KMW74172.1 hypothetical protein TI10_08135 [Photorhabdus luminescens subsp. luminescens]SCZ63389.1 hypothetical protein SAMN02982990_02064 [Photorhabdus luminescens]
MSLLRFYIRHQFVERMGLALDDDAIFCLFNESQRDYVDTHIKFTKELLLPVMTHLLDSLSEDPANRARCRNSERILTLWIRGMDAISHVYQDPLLMPYTHPESNGRVDTLIRPDTAVLLNLTAEEFLRLTAQDNLPEDEQIGLEQFSKTQKYWTRFMDYLDKQLTETCLYCFERLGQFLRHLQVEPRLIRRFSFSVGYIDVFMGPQDLHNIDAEEFESWYLEDYIDEVSDGLMTPVQFQVDVVYKNGCVIESFRSDVDIENVNNPTLKDYRDVVDEAITWVDEQFVLKTRSVSLSSPVQRLAA